MEQNAVNFDNPLPRIENPYSAQDARQHELQNFDNEQNRLREMEQTHLLGVPSGYGRTFQRIEAQINTNTLAQANSGSAQELNESAHDELENRIVLQSDSMHSAHSSPPKSPRQKPS